MKEYKFRYGNTSVSIPVDESQVIGVIEGNDTTPLSNISGALMDAIDNPIDSAPLSEVAAKASSIAIIVSDMTRYWMRQDLIVPLIVEYLVEKCGKSYEDLTIVIATGTHVGGSEDDLRTLVTSPVFDKVRTINHDCRDKNLVYLGTTSYGTPVSINKEAADADLVVKVPGIPIPYMIKKKAKRITNDIAALLENPKTERMTRIIIAGSKGKTSTASALASALNKLGISAAFSEGLGYSAFHLLSDIENEERTYDAIVIEMSLWQIKDTSASLGHNWPRIDILGITDNIPISLSPTDMSAEGSLFIGPWIRKIIAPRLLWEKLMISGIVRRRSVKMYPSPLNPFRNKPGMELGWECLRAIGFRRKDAKNAFSGYKGIPNRMEFIAVDNGISFINDSSSVLPISVAFSLRGMKGMPVHLILGGTDKSRIDISELRDPIDESISLTLLSGSLTDKLIPLLHRECIKFNGPFDDMNEAVKSAYSSALSHRGKRDTTEIILLSPGAYADEYFSNEFERGARFKEAVLALIEKDSVER